MIPHAEAQSVYHFRHQKNSRIMMHIQTVKANKGKISVPLILVMQNSSPDNHSYGSRQVIFLILRLRWLSFLCLNSAAWTFRLLQTKYLQTRKQTFHMQKLEMFPDCFVLKQCFPSHMQTVIQDHLSEPIYFLLIKVLSYSVLSMHNCSEYLNSSVSVT